MNASSNIVSRSLLQVLALFRRGGWTADYAVEEPPLRSELFSADRMEQHGKRLAAAHKLTSRSGPNRLLQRLGDASKSGVYRAARTDEILDATRGSALQVSRIDLSGAADKQVLMERIARALEFPSWFGGK